MWCNGVPKMFSVCAVVSGNLKFSVKDVKVDSFLQVVLIIGPLVGSVLIT